jgi:outer membrane protein TolC
MNCINKFIIAVIALGLTTGYGQQLLTKTEAVSIALENNYGIKIATNNIKIAENNASIYNSEFLPKVSANTGLNYRIDDTKLTDQENAVSEINNSETNSLNSSVALNFIFFDGLGRSYNFKRLKESHNLSELEAQAIIENTLLQVFTWYFEVGRLTENTLNIQESLEISKNRLKRASYGFDYGQNTKLQVLNAEVDVNNDSILYINSKRLLANSKRNLNLILGREISDDFTVDTSLTFERMFDLESLFEKAKAQNIEIQKIEKNIELGDFDIKINESRLYPTLSLNTDYNHNKSNNDNTFNYAEQRIKGLHAGLNLSWNIFDGGSTKTRIKNAKIFAENLQVQKELLDNELKRNVANNLETFNNALFVLKSEEKNVETNRRNFSRTEEQYKLGQITSIEFRQAQVNLLNALSNLNQAKYDAKNSELQLLQQTGELIDSNF